MKEKVKRVVSEFNTELKLKGFRAFQIEQDGNETRVYSRKEFYKICLTTGKSKIHYSDKSFEQEGTVLFFGNPHIPYSWETISTTYKGYTILFSEEFFKNSERSESLQQSSFFKIGGTPVLKITEDQRQFLNTIFQKMIEEQESDYLYKDELIRNYISLIIHESLKLEPAADFDQNKNAASRLSSVFLELLERQFPIETTNQSLQLKSAQDFAKSLNVHVNYLNRAVKEITGKSTTAHITERILTEAKALLHHTDWNISEIAFALGFDYPTYFNNFFKKQTGTNPKAFRLTEV
ncbi:AraC-like DNA-binding protein [Chryseobacterium bernardetii]|jgi:AraC-like DNA-binding protein|uniref:AraC family transcriptional regulator n=3 Tax=Chryseobacterium TaxID=59732 RepID=A0A543ELA3_9FLAO|nr:MULTISPECIES: helix-turn-helix domain-containing protein [Chryseobacterium]MDR6368738.1 AraC-like DNA-binding protein [Chryseobacterium vietnamense]MDR6440339.1 AraC-like DNA-binding protein [Chryseobacterium bernardetii]MDR6458772.1 AraC-like DNA-binding protein [Chryseobacterium vietnamense]TQM22350.1 AraC family transcriptional regulator [Chryseobacterium aquifrigidense]